MLSAVVVVIGVFGEDLLVLVLDEDDDDGDAGPDKPDSSGIFFRAS